MAERRMFAKTIGIANITNAFVIESFVKSLLFIELVC
jgi:hypothetical protein